MKDYDENKLIISWIKLQGLDRDTKEAEELMWASNSLIRTTLSNPEKAWHIILEILQQTDDEWVLTNVAAGPLEDLLAQHPDTAINLLEEEVQHNKKLRSILNGVWQNLMPDDVWKRLQKLL